MQNTQFDFISVYGLFLNHLSRYKKIFFSFIILGLIIGFYNLFTKPTVQYGEFIVRMGDPTDPDIADMILVFDQYALMSGLDKNLFSSVEEYEELLGDLKAFSSIELSTLNRSNFKVIVSFADSNLFVNSPEEVVLKAFQNNKVISDYIHAQEVLLNREIALINEAITWYRALLYLIWALFLSKD